LIPGVVNYSKPVLAFFYFLLLVYLFFGVSIIAEKFMEAIEKLTSIKVPVTISDGKGNE
jgi:solute carrier family 8 (sodium/calcium exchanger)